MDDLYYLKQTVCPSRSIRYHFTNFNVRVGTYYNYDATIKANDSNRLLTPFAWEEMTEPTESMDKFIEEDDDDDLAYPIDAGQSTKKSSSTHLPTGNNSTDCEFLYLNISVGPSSFWFENSIQYQTRSEILCSSVLPGCAGSKDEDTLLLTLKSGFLLGIRFENKSEGLCEPVIVMTINLKYSERRDLSLSLGYKISCLNDGSMFAICGLSDEIDLYGVKYEMGLPRLDDPIRIMIRGIILDMCFLIPKFQNYYMLCYLISTNEGMLKLEYTEGSCTGGSILSGDSLKNSSFLLTKRFVIPRVFIPLPVTKGLLLIDDMGFSVKGYDYLKSHNELDILSARFPHDYECDSKVQAYYVPQTMITCLPCKEYDNPDVLTDQIIISNSSSSSWLLDIFYNGRKCSWSFRCRKLITQCELFSVFSFEKVSDDNYSLFYSNDNGVDVERFLSVVPGKDGGYEFKEEHRKSIKGWFPVYDYLVINSLFPKYTGSNQELWCLSRSGKRGSLCWLRSVIAASTEMCINFPKYAEAIFSLHTSFTPIFVVTSAWNTMIFKLTSESETQIIPLDQYCTDERTIYFASLTSKLFVQVFEHSICIGDFENPSQVKYFNCTFILATSYQNVLAVAYEMINDKGSLEVMVECFQINQSKELIPISVALPSLLDQPSLLSFAVLNEHPYLIIGEISNRLSLYKMESDYNFIPAASIVLDFSKDGTEFYVPFQVAFSDPGTLLVTSKNGVYCVLSYNEGERKFAAITSIKLTDLPIRILQRDHTCYLISGVIWRLDCEKSIYPTRLYFTETNRVLVLDAAFIPGTATKENDHILAITKSGLIDLNIPTTVSVNIHRIKLRRCGLHVIYLSYLKLFVIIMEKRTIEETCLDFVDHKKGRLLKSNEREIELFKSNEFPTALFSWKVPSQRSPDLFHHYLVVACLNHHSKMSSMKIVELKKKNKTDVDLNVLNSWTEKGRISSISQLDDGTLIYGCDDKLMLKRYLPQKRKMDSSKMLKKLMSDIKFITTLHDQIYVTTNIGCLEFRYDGSEIVDLRNDIASKIPSSRVIPLRIESNYKAEFLLTVADKATSSIRTVDLRLYDKFNSSNEMAWMKVPYIPRIYPCDFRPPWRKLKYQSNIVGTFLSVGVDGQVDLITLVKRKEYMEMFHMIKSISEKNKDKQIQSMVDLTPFDHNIKSTDGNHSIDVDLLINRPRCKLSMDKLLHASVV